MQALGSGKLDFENKKSIPPPKVAFKRDLAKVSPTDVLVDANERGKVFCHIDDLITVGLFSSDCPTLWLS